MKRIACAAVIVLLLGGLVALWFRRTRGDAPQPSAAVAAAIIQPKAAPAAVDNKSNSAIATAALDMAHLARTTPGYLEQFPMVRNASNRIEKVALDILSRQGESTNAETDVMDKNELVQSLETFAGISGSLAGRPTARAQAFSLVSTEFQRMARTILDDHAGDRPVVSANVKPLLDAIHSGLVHGHSAEALVEIEAALRRPGLTAFDEFNLKLARYQALMVDKESGDARQSAAREVLAIARKHGFGTRRVRAWLEADGSPSPK